MNEDYDLPSEQLIEIANRFGTPLYIYNPKKITDQYNKLTAAFQKNRVRFFYACKSLTNVNILKHIKNLGCNIDCVSLNEIHLAMLAGFQPKEILFTPNSISIHDLIKAKELGVLLNIDSISLLEQFGNQFGNSYPICIRINPNILAGGNYKISTGHLDSKFGISIHQMRHIERIVKSTHLQVEGLHTHTGSEIIDVDVFIRGLDVLLEASEHFPHLKYIDLGSGFKVKYKSDDLETDIALLGQKIEKRFQKFKEEHNRDLEIWFEPGKYLVSDAGYFIAQATQIKPTMSSVFVGLNTGFNHLIRPMFYDAYHEIDNLSNPFGVERLYTIVGNICETDTFAWDRKINEVREGDLLLFRNAGAYGFEMASNFNSQLRPAEVLVNDNEVTLIRKRETFDDLIKNQIIP